LIFLIVAVIFVASKFKFSVSFYVSRTWSSFDDFWRREIGEAAIRPGFFSLVFLIVAVVFGASKNKNLAFLED